MNLEEATPKPCHVLVVEDDPITRTVLETVLRSSGFIVTSSANGEESLKILAQEVFDLVLLDLNLEGLSGFDVAARIRSGELGSVHTQVPIIAFTGEDAPKQLHRCKEVGMNGCLRKPFDVRELKLLLKEWCRGRSIQHIQEPMRDALTSDPKGIETYSYILCKKFEGDTEFIKSVLRTFQSDVPEKISQLEEAYRIKDWNSLERVAHSLKGAAAILELTYIRDEASHLETLAKKEDFLYSNASIEKLKNLFYQIDFEAIIGYLGLIKKGG